MNGLPDYYGQQYNNAGQSGTMDDYGQNNMQEMDTATLNQMMSGERTLDQIINQNHQDMMRRNTYQTQYPNNSQTITHMRRASMMEFDSPLANNMADFQFDPNPAQAAVSNRIANAEPAQKALDPRKVRSREDLNIGTRFSQIESDFNSYSSGMMPSSIPHSSMSMDSNNNYLPQTMDLSMEFDDMGGDPNSINMLGGNLSGMYMQSPMQQTFPTTYNTTIQKSTMTTSIPTAQAAMVTRSSSGTQLLQNKTQRTSTAPSPLAVSQPMGPVQPVTMSPPMQAQLPSSGALPAVEEQQAFAGPVATSMKALTVGPTKPSIPSQFPNAYSSSGFDMLGMLMRVATRKNPQITIGPVDLSCAFVVCDLSKHDLPIIYCSEVFERLTGYTRSEILGRNCRFLQAPDGKVLEGVKRKYVDDRSVLHLKNQINRRQEAQLSLINYRKGGQPFMNLLTMIPVPLDSDEFRFYVGFQVDLVEQPNSVSSKNPDGSYAVNYQRGQLPRYVMHTPETNNMLQADLGQTIPRDDVSTALSTVGSGESENVKRIWDKVLLENTDDVVHVLSLKGLFLYLSPASRKVLEYDASELVGTALSSVCHPSDIVPVTRELKETSQSSAVNVVYRIRRKHSGYTWFESHGCLHTEQGKGRKCIILVGRARPVYALDRTMVRSDGTFGDTELWTKMSTSGMFLYISSNVKQVLDRLPEDLVGTSMQALMRPEARKELGAILEVARTGKKASLKHDIQNRRGNVLQAETTIYPGDAQEGTKPTFFLAQTRLLKMTRALMQSHRPESTMSAPTDKASLGSATPFSSSHATQTPQPALSQTVSAMSSQSGLPNEEGGVITAAGGSGLPLGNQDEALASEDNIFDELKTTRSTSWQFELRQMERQNRLLLEELQTLTARKKKRKRTKNRGQTEKDCANCHKRVTPEWRRGPSGNRDLCNSCGLRWAKQVSSLFISEQQCDTNRRAQNGRVSPRKSSGSTSPRQAEGANAGTGGASKTPQQSSGSNNKSPGSLTQIQPKLDKETSMPPKIDEEPEPAHERVLPA
jgi:PAS domain S-box-containing protein